MLNADSAGSMSVSGHFPAPEVSIAPGFNFHAMIPSKSPEQGPDNSGGGKQVAHIVVRPSFLHLSLLHPAIFFSENHSFYF